ncbi:MAG: hypothetical protein GY862_00315 [Gammaproteobacteria bacterium]|nr:hypothetical protein [Gammaproteobacteria bacterium]
MLDELKEGTLGITPEFGACLAQAASVCLVDQGHSSPSNMEIKGEIEAIATVIWDSPTKQAIRCWNDDEIATEHGAYGIATVLVSHISGLQVIERSKKGTGFDYWLGAEDDTAPLFQQRTSMEVSGIRNGTKALVKRRVQEKLSRLEGSNSSLPAYVIVVEFSGPLSEIIKK